MAILSKNYGWTFASSGVRTRIAAGPLVHAAPVQWLEFGHRGVAPKVPVGFVVTVYSAAAPWYLNASGVGTEWDLFADGAGGLDTSRVPWDTGYPLWLLGSPWIEVYVTTSRSCLARLEVL